MFTNSFHQAHSKLHLAHESIEYSHDVVSDKSNQKKLYLAVFQQAKQIKCLQTKVNQTQAQKNEEISNKIKSSVKIMNQPQNLSLFEINKAIMLLGSLISINQLQICNVEIKKNFLIKIVQFLAQFAEDESANELLQEDCKIALLHCFLYILVISISSKTKLGSQSSLKDKILKDKRVLSSFLNIRISKQRNIGKLYGIVIVFIVKQKLTKKIQQKLMKSILSCFRFINHQKTQLNMLMILKDLKNKYNIHSSLIKDSQIIQKLKSVFLTSKNYHQSFYALDFLLHLKLKFPVFSKQILSSQIAFKITDTQYSSFILTNTFTTQVALRYLKETAIVLDQNDLVFIIQRNLSLLAQKNKEEKYIKQSNSSQNQNKVCLVLAIIDKLTPFVTSETGLFKLYNEGILETLVKSFETSEKELKRVIFFTLQRYLLNITSINQKLGQSLKSCVQLQINDTIDKQFSAGQEKSPFKFKQASQSFQAMCLE